MLQPVLPVATVSRCPSISAPRGSRSSAMSADARSSSEAMRPLCSRPRTGTALESMRRSKFRSGCFLRTRELLSTNVERAVDRAALHAPAVPLDAQPVLITAIHAERSGTPSVAVATSFVTTVTLGLGITLGNLDSQTAGSSSAVVLAGSALFAGIVAQRGEHKLVRDVFIGARLMLVLVALSALAAAASIAFGATCDVRGWIWGGGAVTSAGATASLAVAWKNAKPLRRRQDPSDTGDKMISA